MCSYHEQNNCVNFNEAEKFINYRIEKISHRERLSVEDINYYYYNHYIFWRLVLFHSFNIKNSRLLWNRGTWKRVGWNSWV